jgi:hypothetical protein
MTWPQRAAEKLRCSFIFVGGSKKSTPPLCLPLQVFIKNHHAAVVSCVWVV